MIEKFRWKSIPAKMWVLAALIAVAPHTGPAVAAPPSQLAPSYKNNDYLFRFQPPIGWFQKTDMPKGTVAFLGTEDNGFTANLTVNIYVSPVDSHDLEKFARGIKIEHGVITERKQCTLGGDAAYMWRTKLTIPGHPAAENRQLVCIHNNRAYELALTSAQGFMHTKYDAVFESWIASFGWTQPASPFKQPASPFKQPGAVDMRRE